MSSKFLLSTFVLVKLLMVAINAKDCKSGLQERFTNLLSRQALVSHSSGMELKASVRSQLQYIVSICSSEELFRPKNQAHNEALLALKNILREERNPESLVQLAGDLRDFPHMNFHLWLAAFLSVSYERDDLVTLQRPHPLGVTPELYFYEEAYEMATLQAQIAPEERVCIPVDGSLFTKTENGKEHALWYLREDILYNFAHAFWHYVHPVTETSEYTIDRRGELFWFFHRVLLSRYDTERLTMGLDRVKPLVIEEGFVIEEGYWPHMAEIGGYLDFGHRPHNTTLMGPVVSELEGFIKNVTDDTQEGFLVSENGTLFSLLNSQGVDLLGNNVEAYYMGINHDRYKEMGVHNAGHEHFWTLIEDGTFGIMGTGIASRDPMFYRWHKTIDNIFQLNKVMLPPYTTTQGDFPLVWNDVNITSVEVTSANLPATPNILETFMGTQIVELPYTPDGAPPPNGTLQYCIKRLDHTDFQYKITTMRSENSAAVNATVRVFMAPRIDEAGKIFSLPEQRFLFFPLDNFQVTLNSGETLIIRNSTQSTLSVPWKLEGSGPVPTFPDTPHCGCGWPHHFLLPRGKPEGMPFDLFVLITDSTTFEAEPDDVCISARILCGAPGKKYPDPFPMGYPFDRRPFNDPETNSPVSSIEKYSQFIPNSKVIQVSIFHNED